MANVGTAAAGKTLIGAGNGASPTYADIGTNSGLTAHGPVIAEGNGAFVAVSPGTLGQVLTSNGAGADPSFKTATDLHTARYIVSPGGAADGANYSSINAAYTAASTAGGNQTVFLQPGTYTENVILNPNINLCAYICDALTPNVTIVGKLTFTQAGSVSISGIRLQTNSDFAIAVTGNTASVININNCYLNFTNNTGITFSSSSGSSAINISNCLGNLGTTGIGIYTDTSSGSLYFTNTIFTNTGASTTASTKSANAARIRYCMFASAFSCSSTATYSIDYSIVDCSSINTAALTLAGSGTSFAKDSQFLAGSATAISVGSGTTLLCTDEIRVDSSNTNAVDGIGTIRYGLITYSGSSSKNNVTTLTPYVTQPQPGWILLQTLTASTSASLEFINIKPTFSNYSVVLNNVKPATNAQDLQLLFSVDNGANYLVSSYKSGINYLAYNSATVTNSNSTTNALVAITQSNGVGLNGVIYLTPNNGSWLGNSHFAIGSNYEFGMINGSCGQVYNAFKFLFASGNITSGSISLYGIQT